jgi:NitT/TauT family transport system substrate-binding protein
MCGGTVASNPFSTHPSCLDAPTSLYRSSRRTFIRRLCALASSAGLLGYELHEAFAQKPPEITKVRLVHAPAICLAPQYVALALLEQEGFIDVKYIQLNSTTPEAPVAAGEADISMSAAPALIAAIDTHSSLVVLAGVHLGCYELFGTEQVRAIRDLKGKTVPVSAIGAAEHVFLSSMAAYVGLDPHKDIKWVVKSSEEAMRLLAERKVDAYLAFPPEPQELRAKKVGHVVVNTAIDKPWSQYFCCMLAGNREFVRNYPAATKRVIRAFLKAADLCARKPEWAARFIVEKGFAKKYDYALETLRDVSYNAWRTYDPDTTIRFHALRLHEVGMIKSHPQRIIAEGTDWRLLNELKNELKA